MGSQPNLFALVKVSFLRTYARNLTFERYLAMLDTSDRQEDEVATVRTIRLTEFGPASDCFVGDVSLFRRFRCRFGANPQSNTAIKILKTLSALR